MFDEPSIQEKSVDLNEYLESEPLDLRAIIRANDTLPRDIKTAAFAHVEERVMDRTLLKYLSEWCPDGSPAEERESRRIARQSALSAYLGHTLHCVFIRLPGGHYTIEIAADEQRIVHWEWQAT